MRELDLAGTLVTGAGLEHLKGLTRLQSWCSKGTTVTDAGLEHLKGLTQLRKLYLYGTEVTDARLNELRKALPNCQVFH